MNTETQVKKVLQMVNDIKNLLPKYAEAELTLRLRTEEEIKAIAGALKISYMKPTVNFHFHWCLYKSGPVNIHIQTHDVEQEQTPQNLTLN